MFLLEIIIVKVYGKQNINLGTSICNNENINVASFIFYFIIIIQASFLSRWTKKNYLSATFSIKDYLKTFISKQICLFIFILISYFAASAFFLSGEYFVSCKINIDLIRSFVFLLFNMLYIGTISLFFFELLNDNFGALFSVATAIILYKSKILNTEIISASCTFLEKAIYIKCLFQNIVQLLILLILIFSIIIIKFNYQVKKNSVKGI